MPSDRPVENTFVNRLIGRSEGARQTRRNILNSLFLGRPRCRRFSLTTLRLHLRWVFRPYCKRCGDRHDSGLNNCYPCLWHFIETFLYEDPDAQ